MRRLIRIPLVFLLMLVPATVFGQDLKVGASVGPNFILDLGKPHVIDAGFALTGGATEGLNVSVFAERHRIRLELMYNRLTAHSSSWHYIDQDSLVRHAMRDEAFALNAVRLLTLSRSSRFQTYLAAGAGVVYSRLGTTPEPDPRPNVEITQTESGVGLGFNVGIGARIKVGVADLMVESRWFRATNDIRGRSFVPVQVGVLIPT